MTRKFILLFFYGILLLTGCKDKQENHKEHVINGYYTCPMHPSVQSKSPGACPICGMTLVKVEQKEKPHEELKGNFITLNKQQQLLAGIKTDTVKFKTITATPTILGTVSIDEEQVTAINSRVKGRIDKLFVKTTGGFIQKGNPVYGIYSEELFADEKEFLALTEKKKHGNSTGKFLDDLLIASRNKLLLWGLTENQISELEKNKTAFSQIIFYSTVAGYVTAVLIKEGMYVEEGTPLIKLAELKQVWVEAQVYTNEKINYTNSFQIYSETFPEDIYTGRLVFDNPGIEEGSKIQLLKIRVDNAKGKLIPGMMVYVNPKKNTESVLSIPKSALLLEKMKTVWIKTDETTFEQRMIETGSENKFLVEILSGLKPGEIIVTSGAYLVSSEFILKSGASQRHNH